MLSKEFLRLHRKGDRAIPLFVDTADPELLNSAETILAVYRAAAAAKSTRGELAEQLENIRDPGRPLDAFAKILEDGCRFADATDCDYPVLRQKLFAASAARFAGAETPEALCRELAEMPELTDFLQQDIYGDLPENQALVFFRDMSPGELLERYNVALVQGLLLYAKSLQVCTAEAESAELRRLFKYLKFFRLLAAIRRTENGFAMEISGPLAIFANTRKYAVQLAAFFPAVIQLKKWHIAAKVEWKGRELDLILDESAGLKSPYRNFSAYVPEEIRMFHRLFKEKVTDWSIVGETPLLPGPRGEVFFPDLSFAKASSGRRMNLELFHRWHKGQLDARIRFLAKHPELALLIGIDRSIANEADLENYVKEAPGLAGKLFLFRDFPGVERVVKLLRES